MLLLQLFCDTLNIFIRCDDTPEQNASITPLNIYNPLSILPITRHFFRTVKCLLSNVFQLPRKFYWVSPFLSSDLWIPLDYVITLAFLYKFDTFCCLHLKGLTKCIIAVVFCLFFLPVHICTLFLQNKSTLCFYAKFDFSLM